MTSHEDNDPLSAETVIRTSEQHTDHAAARMKSTVDICPTLSSQPIIIRWNTLQQGLSLQWSNIRPAPSIATTKSTGSDRGMLLDSKEASTL